MPGAEGAKGTLRGFAPEKPSRGKIPHWGLGNQATAPAGERQQLQPLHKQPPQRRKKCVVE